VNSELEREVMEEVIMAWFMVLSCQLYEGTEENHKVALSGWRLQELNSGPTKY
jgi:hypothetical protein